MINKKFLLAVLGITISIISIYLLLKKVDIASTWQQIRELPSYSIPLLMGIYLIGFILRGWRWRWMFPTYSNFPFMRFLNAVVVGFAGNNLLPARGGELLRMEYFSRKTGINRVTSLTSVLAERILDGFSLLLILFVTLFFSSEFLEVTWVKTVAYSASFLFGGLIIALVILKWQKYALFTLAGKILGNHALKIIEIIEKVSHAIEFINWDRRTLRILNFSILIWLVEGSMFVVALWLFHIPVNVLLAGYFCLSILNFGLLVPSSPGFIGVFQAMTILALGLYAVPAESALALGIVVHAMQFIPITIWGVFILAVNSIKLFQKRESVD